MICLVSRTTAVDKKQLKPWLYASNRLLEGPSVPETFWFLRFHKFHKFPKFLVYIREMVKHRGVLAQSVKFFS